MQRELARQLLRALLSGEAWNEETLPKLFADLEVLADYKYNRYEMYQPGRMFLESLYLWLMPFSEKERATAIRFVRDSLVFVSREEFQQLAHVLYHDLIHQRHLDMVSARTGVPRHRIAQLVGSEELRKVQRASLYIAMSDGARIDYFRRQNLDINNEQVLTTHQPSDEKVEDLGSELEKSLGPGAKFSAMFLLDDFCGSGKTLLREVIRTGLAEAVSIPERLQSILRYDVKKRELELAYSPNVGAAMEPLRKLSSSAAYAKALGELAAKAEKRETVVKGSLARLAKTKLFGGMAPDAVIYLCPLIITEFAKSRLEDIIAREKGPLGRVRIMPGSLFPDSARVLHGSGDLAQLCEKHYSEGLEDEHTGNVMYGYEGCGLPLVLHHNTPNNSIYILWARKWKDPLFIRYERHGREGA